MRTTNTLTFLASVMMLGACGDSSETGGGGSGNGTSVGAGTSTGGEGGVAESCDFAELDLEGLWAVKLSLPAQATGATGGPLSVCPGTQDGELTTVMLMRVVSLDPTHSGSFTMCTLGLPTVATTANTACSGGTLDTSYHRQNERFTDLDSEPQAITVDGNAPGAAFSLDPVGMYFGAGPPLPEWDTAEPLCDDPLLGRGVCEPDCVSGACADGTIDGFDNDEPGFTFAICGLGNSEILDNCNTDDPSDPEGTTIQGTVYSTFYMVNTFAGSFATSCEGTADVTTDFDMTYVGGNLYVGGTQISVTEEVKSLPAFALTAGGGTAHLVRIDGRFGSPDYEVGDDEDTCDTVLQNIATL